ncbi:tetratricopeptide repeat protein [Nocardia sp. NPDC101769]|uniref:tetratricopeptide repeat protein n=1 Tax=Nocardia sp. NPDC101769 TaxID=3364333 RepID=UPI00382C9AE0
MLVWVRKRSKAVGRFAGRIGLFCSVALALCGGLIVAYTADRLLRRITPVDPSKGAAEIDLVAVDDTNPPRPIPETYRQQATTDAESGTVAAGVAAYDRGLHGMAEGLFRRAADAGHTSAMFDLGVLLEDRGELAEAETWWRRAAEAGHVGAMHSLEILFREGG